MKGQHSRRSVKYRWLKKGEARMGMRAIADLWNPNHILSRDERLFNWQYRLGKSPDELGFLLAEADGEIIGISGIILQNWLVRGRSFSGGTGSITIILPEWRVSAAGLDLIDEADRGLAIVGSFGVPERTARLYRLQGRHVSLFPRAVAIGSRDALRAYLDKCAYAPGHWQMMEESCAQLDKIPLPPGWRVEELAHDLLPEWEECWTRVFAPDFTGVARNADYLAWRFLDHPTYTYKILLARNPQNEISGFAACRLVPLPGDTHALRVTDFLPENDMAGRALAAAIGELADNKCAYVEFYQLSGNFDALGELGLSANGSGLVSVYTNPPDPATCDRTVSLRVNIPGMRASDLAAISNLHMTLADTDQDRPN